MHVDAFALGCARSERGPCCSSRKAAALLAAPAQAGEARLTKLFEWQPHSLEAWCVAWSREPGVRAATYLRIAHLEIVSVAGQSVAGLA
jgi:hypothetical protein